MIRSMTGFGEASAHVNGVHYFLEARSLNNRYFKATIRLPDELQGLEPELDAELRRRLTRGTVTLIAKCADASEHAAYEINHLALGRYIEQIGRAPHLTGGAVRIDAGALRSLPGVLQQPSDDEHRLARARGAFMGIIGSAMDKLIAMREREGKALAKDLLRHHDLIVDRLERIRGRAPAVVEEYHTRLRQRVESMRAEAGVTVQPADLIREVAIYAERSDIAEEVTRLTGHMAQFRDLVTAGAGEPVGRTLEFLAQEMLREANTIASKSSDADLSRHAVEVKGAIDRIKEQVQNVE